MAIVPQGPGPTTTAWRDDRVLPATRVLSAVLVPFLVSAFVILYGFPGDTEALFAWTIRPELTPMVLASAYLGGAWFFVRVVRERRWARVGAGLSAVVLFAGLLGVATVLHWDRFNHGHPAFWLWAALYFTAPVAVAVVWAANDRRAAPPRAGELRLGLLARSGVVLGSALALGTGLFLFAWPAAAVPVWPWPLTPLTCRVVGAVFCLGSAGLVAARDPRWVRLRLMVEVETVMLALVVAAMVRARGDLRTDRVLTWLLVGGLAGTLVASLGLWRRMALRERAAGAGRLSAG